MTSYDSSMNLTIVADQLLKKVSLSKLDTNLTKALRGKSKDPEVLSFIKNSDEWFLCFMIDAEGKDITIMSSLPQEPFSEMYYFIKKKQLSLNYTTINKDLIQGNIMGRQVNQLLNIMAAIFIPSFHNDTSWPDSIKNEFSSKLQKFMAYLNDEKWQSEKKTVLYIPIEVKLTSQEVACKNKEMIPRLEMIIIHWTRQIKELLSSQDALQLNESSGPLEEIKFWSNRCDDLYGITMQLDKPGVKKVTSILQTVKSSYVAPFSTLSTLIKEGSLQAQSNLKYLKTIEVHCEKLSTLTPKEIPQILPKLLNLIRLIWNYSPYYNTKERITGLLRKLSSEVINRCSASINLDNIFGGYINSSKAILFECISCCENWKSIYKKTQDLHLVYSELAWDLDFTAIFAQVDAFIQRCSDLVEVCDCKFHFSRLEDGKEAPMPIFKGKRGSEALRALIEIENIFENHMSTLQAVKKNILDVKAISWIDDFSRFRNGMKDLEVMMQNLINSAFDTIITVEEGVDLLDIFINAVERPGIKRTIEKKTEDIWGILNAELNFVKREISQKSLFLSPWKPKYAGMCAWVKMMKRSLEREISFLDRSKFLPVVATEEDIRHAFSLLCLSIDEFAMRCYNDWIAELMKVDPYKLHDAPLLKRNVEKGMIDINYDENLMKAFREVTYWEQLNYELPGHIYDVLLRREAYRVQRENVMLVVREYNRIVSLLSASERGLFRERIMFLDRKILPGLTKITWSQNILAEQYLLECKTNTTKIQHQIDSYKAANMEILDSCVKISELLLLNINRKTVYEDSKFETSQKEFCGKALESIKAKHQTIMKVLLKTFEFFKNDGPEVQQSWMNYTIKVDYLIEDALRANIKQSFQEITRSIIGDGKAGQAPTFKLNLILKKREGQEIMDFSPSLQELNRMIMDTVEMCLNALSTIERLPNVLKNNEILEPMNTSIEKDPDVMKIEKVILAGIQTGIKGLHQYLSGWLPFKEIWEVDKDYFIEKYELTNPSSAAFDADIDRYSELSSSVQMLESIIIVHFALVDASMLKVSVTSHCQEWQNRLCQVLNTIAKNNLERTYKYIEESRAKLVVVPNTLDQLESILIKWDELNNEKTTVEASFSEIFEQYNVLHKHDVEILEEMSLKLKNLNKEWNDYCHELEDTEFALKKIKDKFRQTLLAQAEDLKKQILSTVEDFHTKGPFNANIALTDAQEIIQNFKEYVKTFREQEMGIRQGLMLFKLDQPASRDVNKMELELDHLEDIWKLVGQWQAYWNSWKDISFTNVKLKELDDLSNTIYKKALKLSKELKTYNWAMIDTLKKNTELFRSIIPVIGELNNPHFRPRHWQQIENVVGKQFDQNDERFTIEKIIEMEFFLYAEKITEISFSASKEILIETSLNEISTSWENIEFDFVFFKDKETLKIRSIEEVLKNHEENQSRLNIMKFSKYAQAFLHSIVEWEGVLSTILESVESLLSIQRTWLYLEQIFSAEDVRKQMIKETIFFDDVNQKWKMLMSQLFKIKNVYMACHRQDLLIFLEKIKNRLEFIMNSLDLFFETKRKVFPRFYFISNTDMIEIMGLSRTPVELQYYIRKCFEFIKTLTMSKVGLSQKWEATHMNSAEGESVAFNNSIQIEEHAEVWFLEMEKMMKATVKEELKKCKTSLRRNMSKREKWLKENSGQACICATLIQWTTDVTRSLIMVKENGEKNALKVLKKKIIGLLNKVCQLIHSSISPLVKAKTSAFITIKIHCRDVVDRLFKANCADPNSFDWMKEFRSYWDRDSNEYIIKQTNCSFPYNYEYLGNTSRIVITPLTDRCYITMLCALYTHKLGALRGGVGTGKTETVKDVGKALGSYVVCINCSEKLDYKSMGRFFSGLVQAGVWGCFDEFNRINIEVLSVVAQKLFSIFSALASHLTSFIFEGSEIKLNPNCGIFATMNYKLQEAYEIPDNLKAMFRPVALLVPDILLIVETLCFVEGFTNSKVLSKKLVNFYSLAQQQLTRKAHYNLSVRAIVLCVKFAGVQKREVLTEEEIFVLSILNCNIAMLDAKDIPVFMQLVFDIFPGVEVQNLEYPKVDEGIKIQLDKLGLKKYPQMIKKLYQLFELRKRSHCSIVLGETLTGKSSCLKVLKETLCYLATETDGSFEIVKDFALNPKAFTLTELYGEFNHVTNEWTDGIIPRIMRGVANDEKSDGKWIIFDGPVDSLWVESMNSLIDETKTLTLINGERISLTEQMLLLFEVHDLAQSSAATVSRCGVVFFESSVDIQDAYFNSWINTFNDTNVTNELKKLYSKYLEKIENFKTTNLCFEPVFVQPMNHLISFCRLFNSLYSQLDLTDAENLNRMVELTFVFSMMWSFCSVLDEEGRKKVDSYIRDLEGTFPTKDTVFEYYVDYKLHTWVHWEEKLKTLPKLNSSLPFHKMIVPNIDTLRYAYLLENLIMNNYPVLLAGPQGSGKSSFVHNFISELDEAIYSHVSIPMFSNTKESKKTQEIIEARLEKRTKEIFCPINGKKLLIFIDDMNMGKVQKFGSQPTLELIRFLIDYGFWYERKNFSLKYVQNLLWLGAMTQSDGSRSKISSRLQNKFNHLYLCSMPEFQLKKIFSTLLSLKLVDFDEDLKLLSEPIAQISVELLKTVSTKLLPSPSRTHYTFNLYDLSKLYSGLMRVNKTFVSKNLVLRLWIHECYRVFYDRLINEADRDTFLSILNDKLLNVFDVSLQSICKDKIQPIFGDFLNNDLNYEEYADFSILRNGLKNKIPSNISGISDLNLNLEKLMLKDSLEYVVKMSRVLRQSKSYLLCVGVGGSGKTSLARFAAFLCQYKSVFIETDDEASFIEELNKTLKEVILTNTTTVIVVKDEENQGFLFKSKIFFGNGYDILSLNTKKEIYNEYCDQFGYKDLQDEAFFNMIDERLKKNVRIVVGLSQFGSNFRTLIRRYAPVINASTIIWFSELNTQSLIEVATMHLEKFSYFAVLEEIEKTNICKMFAFMHRCIENCSAKIFEESGYYIYVTLNHHYQVLRTFCHLLEDKRNEITVYKTKLEVGLSKIDETKVKVQSLTEDMFEAKKMVEQFQKQCEEYLSSIVQQKREADEQAKSVAQKSEKIAEEELKCRKMAEVAQADLAEALPGLEEAKKALEALNKKDITEIKSYGKPPLLVEKVLEAVMILRGNEPTWAEAKRQLSDSNFIKQLLNFDADNISDRCLKKITAYCIQSDFQPEIVGRVSIAAKSLCMWVRAIEQYAKIYRVVEPKRYRLQVAEEHLNEKRKLLLEAKSKLQEIEDKVKELKNLYELKLSTKEEFKKKAELMELKLERASQLVEGLEGEKDRWQITVEYLEKEEGMLIGNLVSASVIVNYLGVFKFSIRYEVMDQCFEEMKRLQMPHAADFKIDSFLSDPTKVRDWTVQGLPGDSFSVQNAIIAKKSFKFPLMIDPHEQASKWICNMEAVNNLRFLDQLSSDFLKNFEMALIHGHPVLIENVSQTLHKSVLFFVFQSLSKQASKLRLKFLKREIDVDPNFRMYVTTKVSEPSYSTKISLAFNIINFEVKEEGLENQFLGVILRKERPELEDQKDALVTSIGNGKKKIKELNDDILRLLNEVEGSLLDDEQLLVTLQSSKTLSQEVNDSLQVSEATELKIDKSREGYRPSAERASILFFALNDMFSVDPMYHFSLDSYVDLFSLSIDKSHKSTKVEERIQYLNDYHTFAVYRFGCRGLFEKHKLIFAFNMCTKILVASGKIYLEELNFFLRGGIVLDRDSQVDNPCAWLPDVCWDNITELDKLTNFHGLLNSFEQYQKDWNNWYISAEPETSTLPGEWDIACNELQRFLIVRSLRQDRVSFCVTSFITNNLGSKFVEPPILSLKSVLDEANNKTPLTFILSSGFDPTHDLMLLAESKGMVPERFHSLSLGQGQIQYAQKLILEGAKDGHWIFLANCHLSVSWLPTLGMIVTELQKDKFNCHADFRLWLSCIPNIAFPISILHSGINMTSEAPKGVKANMKRIYARIDEAHITRSKHHEKYKKLLFCLAFFHSIIIERKKFLTLGWNSLYDFNDSDFEISDNFLNIYLDEYEEVPWDALKFLIATINYGGHITDDWDKRLMNVYISELFVEEVIATNFFKLTSLPAYYVPKDGSLNSYREYISMLPNLDHPELFGQHTNADVICQIEESKALFDTLLLIKSKRLQVEKNKENRVMEIAETISKMIPEFMDEATAEKTLASDKSPLKNVLFNELSRYNQLLKLVKNNLAKLQKGIKGIIIMTEELEQTFNYFLESKVPPNWLTIYPSLKPLASWVRDLVQRVDHFNIWASTASPPKIFWLSAFSAPISFLSAVLQTFSHSLGIPIDMLTWDFIVMNIEDNNIAYAPKDGVLIKGLYLQGAGWDSKNSCLVEAEPMQLINNLPTILFKPVELKRRNQKGIYQCPCYYYPNREGEQNRASYVVSIDLKAGEKSQEHWIKRGIAALLSLDT